MEKRSQEILLTLIREHIKTAQPVGSEILVSKYKLPVSSATIRNELVALEKDGYIVQPHTSAGRIPTKLGYSVWVANLKPKKVSPEDLEVFEKLFADSSEDGSKLIAKNVAHLAHASVFWAFNRRNFYHTGISNLLTQPEFVGSNLIYDISAVVDRMEDVIAEHFDCFNEGVEVLLGDDNPFSNICGAVVLKFRRGITFGVVGLLAPLRQDYEKNVAIMNLLASKLNTSHEQAS